MLCAEWFTSVDSRRLPTVELKSKAFLAVDSGARRESAAAPPTGGRALHRNNSAELARLERGRACVKIRTREGGGTCGSARLQQGPQARQVAVQNCPMHGGPAPPAPTGGVEGIYWSSLDVLKPQNPANSEEYQGCGGGAEGVLAWIRRSRDDARGAARGSST
eukprot:2671966-Pyramimonas_sp.AAC.1